GDFVLLSSLTELFLLSLFTSVLLISFGGVFFLSVEIFLSLSTEVLSLSVTPLLLVLLLRSVTLVLVGVLNSISSLERVRFKVLSLILVKVPLEVNPDLKPSLFRKCKPAVVLSL